jgi:hypothetical protein
MAIVDTEKGTARPEFGLLELRLDYVKNDGDAVFVVVTDDALMGVGCIRDDYTVTFACEFSWLVGLHEPSCRIEF